MKPVSSATSSSAPPRSPSSSTSGPSGASRKQLGPLLERLAVEYNGRFLLAKVDVDANQMLMQQFGIQGIPAVFAVVAGQALPLFQGAAPEAQIRETLDQLIQVGEERFGLTGIAVDPDAAPADAVPAEVPMRPVRRRAGGRRVRSRRQ